MSARTASQTGGQDKSTQTFISALVLYGAIAGAELAAFLILRRNKKLKPVYDARNALVPEEDKELRPEPLPKGFFGVIPAVIRANEKDIIRYNGLDAYLYVRFLKLMMWIFAPVAFLTWTILLPVYGTGNGGKMQMNRLTFGNIGTSQNARYAAPLILTYLSTFWILYIVHREWKSYIQLRREYLTSNVWRESPRAAAVLVSGIPKDLITLDNLHSYADPYPGGVASIWLARDPGDELQDAYDRRQDAGQKLEKGANKVLKKATKLVKKDNVSADGDGDQEKNGSKLSRYLPEKKMPTHRTGKMKIPCLGEKVNTLDWCNEEIEETNKIIEGARNVDDFENRYKANACAFIMFNDQISAHEFAQNLNNTMPKKLKMCARIINVHPDDVIWENTNVDARSNMLRKIVSWGITIVTIIFWSAPVAFVSSISNVNNLCSTVPFLSWLCTLPTPVNGIIQGALPPLAFAILFALLPIFLRMLSKYEGTPLLSRIELSLQKRYFAFLYIQGFIISVLAGGFMASASRISQDPTATATILANNLPSSNIFFLTLVVTNAARSAAGILQIARLVIYNLKAILGGGTPRALYNASYQMANVNFGELYPAQMLIVVIALAYSTIAPLVCGFALVAFTLWWFCYKYQFIWVQDQDPSMETGGLFFKTALNQMFCGLYITHLSLLGLFFLARNADNGFAALPEAILMVVLLVSCIAAQIWLNYSNRKDNVYLPSSMRRDLGRNGNSREPAATPPSAAAGDVNPGMSDGSGAATVVGEEEEEEEEDGGPGRDGAEHCYSGENRNRDSLNPKGDTGNLKAGSGPEGILNAETEDGYPMKHAYLNPVFYRDQPVLWLARDAFGLSAEQVEKARRHGVAMTDEDATLDKKAKVEIQRDTLPGQGFDP